MQDNPLGKTRETPVAYAPDVLFPIPRADSRAAFTNAAELPFSGEDIWNAWELCWLDFDGRPQIAVAEIRVPATSTNLVESKSLKLYLNSHANERYDSAESLADIIRGDLSRAADATVSVSLHDAAGGAAGQTIGTLPGSCIDAEPFVADNIPADAALLTADAADVRSESLHSHLFRSLCPVTNQPDSGSILVTYRGPALERSGLLRYLVSYRNHNAFHEDCVERIFVDIVNRCAPEALSVYARFQRRGGIDINPFRSNVAQAADNVRLWRQ